MYNYLDFLDKEKECMTNPAGNEYHGTMNKAASGLPCKNWIDVKNYTITASLTVADISKLNDYCRRVPFTEWNGPSCFTSRLERCDVDYCGTTFCISICSGHSTCRIEEVEELGSARHFYRSAELSRLTGEDPLFIPIPIFSISIYRVLMLSEVLLS